MNHYKIPRSYRTTVKSIQKKSPVIIQVLQFRIDFYERYIDVYNLPRRRTQQTINRLKKLKKAYELIHTSDV